MRFFLLFFFFINIAFAHKINLFITNEQNKINIYSYYASGKPCVKCKLIIKNKDKILLQSILDNQGKYIYESKNNHLEISIDASSGHLVKKEVYLKKIDNTSINEQVKEENSMENIKIVLSLILIFLIFYILKRFKRK